MPADGCSVKLEEQLMNTLEIFQENGTQSAWLGYRSVGIRE